MLLIKNGKVLTMAGKILEQGDILIIDSKIAAVEEYIDIALNEDDLLIDAKGLWVMPGIIDAHCHIGISEEKKGKEGEDCNDSLFKILRCHKYNGSGFP